LLNPCHHYVSFAPDLYYHHYSWQLAIAGQTFAKKYFSNLNESPAKDGSGSLKHQNRLPHAGAVDVEVRVDPCLAVTRMVSNNSHRQQL
jgi:hypothetical protein